MAEYINRARVLKYINDIQLTVSDQTKPTILPKDLCEWIFDGISTMPTIEVSPEGVAENATTTDCISRQAAIEALTGWQTEPLDEDIKRTLENLPTVTPTERTGEWIVHSLLDEGRAELECPICGDFFIRAIDYKPHFCEHCGAKMKG